MQRYFLLGCILFAGLIYFEAQGQDQNFDFKSVESKSLSFFNNSQWNELINFGNEAINAGHDYYYLRLRIGIAYFKQNNFLMAIYHLEKALNLNQSDTIGREYLYFAYQYTNRSLEAHTLSKNFNKTLAEKTNLSKSKVIFQAMINGGAIVSNNVTKNKDNYSINQWDTTYASQILNNDKFLLRAQLGLNLSHRMRASVTYTNLTTARLQQIRAPELIISGHFTQVYPPAVYQGNIYDYQMERYSFESTMNQQSVYTTLIYNLGNGLSVSPAAHLLFIHYNYLQTDKNEIAYLEQPWHTENSYKTIYQITETDTTFRNYILSLSGYKSLRIFKLGLGGSYSNINNRNQYQGTFSFTWFPAGNLNFYASSRFTSQYDQTVNEYRFLIYQLLGFKITQKLWAEAFITVGEMLNFNENNGEVVFNSGDLLKFRTGLNFILPISQQTDITLSYHFSAHETYLINESNSGGTYLQPLSYENQLILGGISWKF